MSQYITESKIKEGSLEIYNIPIPNDTDVKVMIIPKVDVDNLLYDKAVELSKTIKGNMSDDIIRNRNYEKLKSLKSLNALNALNKLSFLPSSLCSKLLLS